MRNLKIVGVDVFLEKRKTRLHVGVLNIIKEKFIFVYDDQYFKAKNVIPLGPEFPMTQKQFTSDRLFPSLKDRIPSKENPAYPEYCELMGIDLKEQDPLILLSTIGKKGPSSFIFSPIFNRKISAEDIVRYRESLDLTTREFANVFEFSQNSLNAFERNRITGKDISKRLETLLNFPEVALDLLLVNSGYLIYDKWIYAVIKLREQIKEEKK